MEEGYCVGLWEWYFSDIQPIGEYHTYLLAMRVLFVYSIYCMLLPISMCDLLPITCAAMCVV